MLRRDLAFLSFSRKLVVEGDVLAVHGGAYLWGLTILTGGGPVTLRAANEYLASPRPPTWPLLSYCRATIACDGQNADALEIQWLPPRASLAPLAKRVHRTVNALAFEPLGAFLSSVDLGGASEASRKLLLSALAGREAERRPAVATFADCWEHFAILPGFTASSARLFCRSTFFYVGSSRSFQMSSPSREDLLLHCSLGGRERLRLQKVEVAKEEQFPMEMELVRAKAMCRASR